MIDGTGRRAGTDEISPSEVVFTATVVGESFVEEVEEGDGRASGAGRDSIAGFESSCTTPSKRKTYYSDEKSAKVYEKRE